MTAIFIHLRARYLKFLEKTVTNTVDLTNNRRFTTGIEKCMTTAQRTFKSEYYNFI